MTSGGTYANKKKESGNFVPHKSSTIEDHGK